MNQLEVISQIATVLGNVIDEDDLQLEAKTTADEVEDWDSLTHVKLIISLESHFGVKFDTSEIGPSENVGELADLILQKCA